MSVSAEQFQQLRDAGFVPISQEDRRVFERKIGDTRYVAQQNGDQFILFKIRPQASVLNRCRTIMPKGSLGELLQAFNADEVQSR